VSLARENLKEAVAKRWPDEKKPHKRQTQWTRGQNYSKSNTCTEVAEVYVAGISVKEVRITRGDLDACREATFLARGKDELPEVSRGHRSGRPPAKGRTKRETVRTGNSGEKETQDSMAEMPESDAGRQGRNPENTAVGASNTTTFEEKPHRPSVVSMEEVVGATNMAEAYRRVVSNHGAAGIDGMSVEQLGEYFKKEWPRIKGELIEGKHRPAGIRAVEIPKPNGGTRQLGIPTVLDRTIQQAIQQKLEAVFEPEFSDSSYGFRKGRGTHQAILRAQEYVREGNDWVVDIDLEKFFDRVNHDILMAMIAKKVADKRILKLIRGYLTAGIMIDGITTARSEGTPQGSPLSPLLSNIMLTVLDKELERRGHQFCRYADDCNIYVKSERAGHRVMDSITAFLAKRLKLKVNTEKSTVGRPWELKYLGFQ
jgi:RNA-directed DNA polymerase